METIGEPALNLKYFVGGIPSDATQKQLFDYFKAFGVVKRITIFNNDSRNGKKLYGFCFVKFKRLFVNYSLNDKTRPFVFQGRNLEIDTVIRRSNLRDKVQEKHSRRVFLQNIPKTLEKDDLQKVLSTYGEVINCFIIDREHTRKFLDSPDFDRSQNWKNNYGYVIFERKEDAEYLINQRFIELRNNTRIYIKKYSSSINRNLSEEDASPIKRVRSSQIDTSSINNLQKRQAFFMPTNLTLIEAHSKLSPEAIDHYIKPTTKIYFANSLTLTDTRKKKLQNIRFNICTPC